MRTRYTFTVLRYVHDVVTGEFVNVGVVLYAPGIKFLGAVCASTYGRLSGFFGVVDHDHFKRLMLHIEGAVAKLSERLFYRLPIFDKHPEDVMSCVAEVLPPDDSSLQFAAPGGGVSEDPEATLAALFDRYVNRYGKRPPQPTRTDEQVLLAFRRELRARQVLPRLQPKRIVAPDYEHEFPHAWRNGVWNACEAFSFDMVDVGNVLEKANRWLGRGVTLNESDERFKLYLLLGEPRLQELRPAFFKAINILHKMPCAHELVMEDQAARFADAVRADLEQHYE